LSIIARFSLHLLLILTLLVNLASSLVAATNATATNIAVKTVTNTFVIPKTEKGKRESVLRLFIDAAPKLTLDDLVKKFKLPIKGEEKAIRESLYKYLGLIKIIKDNRKKQVVVLKDYFSSPDIKKNFVVYADEGENIRKEKNPKTGLITLRGEMGNLYVKFKDQTVSASLIRIDLENHEIYGEGNAMLRDSKNIIIGDKFYFNSETKLGILYNAETYMDPYFYKGKTIKKIGDQNYVLEDGWFSTSDSNPVDYRFSVKKAWLYQDLRLVAVDISYEVSGYPIVWFPFLYHPMKGTGLWTGLGEDTRVGWFMQLCNLGKYLNLPFDLTFDYYQKLGFAVQGKKALKIGGHSLGLNVGFGVDKPLQRNSYGEWVNSVNGNNVIGDESGSYGDWKRDIRWKIDLTDSFNLVHDKANPKYGATSFSLKFNLASDPFFNGDFGGARVNKIDINQIYHQDKVNIFNGGGASARNWSFNISDKRGISTLNLSGSWNFNTVINEDHANVFANDYYVYQKSQVILPKLSYGLSGTIFSTAKKGSISATNSKAKIVSKISSKTNVDILSLDEATDAKRKAAANFANFSLSYSGNISFNQTKTYDGDENIVEQRYTRNLNLSLPAKLTLGESFTASLSLGISDSDIWGDATTDAQRQYYATSSLTSFNEGLTMAISKIANKGKINEFGGSFSVSHSLGYKLSDMDSEAYAYNPLHSNKLSASATLNFFRSSISTSAAYDITVLKDELRNWGRDRFAPMTITAKSTPFDNVSISESYSYIIQTGEASRNSLSLSVGLDPFRLPLIDKVSGFKISTAWNHNYNDPRGSSLSFALSFDVEINSMWSVKFAMNTINRELYLYSEEKATLYGQESRSFGMDLLYSLMFWDVDKLKETRFNIQSFSFRVSHDLHQWLMNFDISVNQRKNTVGRQFTYFDFQFLFSVTMKKNIGLTFPTQRYQYTADTDGSYFGKMTW